MTELTVVIPIFNGLHVVEPCLESVARWTDLKKHRLLLIDDGSDSYVGRWLVDWAGRHEAAEVLRLSQNLGFVRACNAAVPHIRSDYAVFLNSDTCVTPRWDQKCIDCLSSDSTIAVASPLSNFAPHMKIDMVPGLDYLAMNALIEELSRREYPDITTPEGFCFVVRMDVLSEIGFFDDVFDDGYGEESDFSMRANYFGYRTVCIDNLYIYHVGRGTFGLERREGMYRRNRSIFHNRWNMSYPNAFEEFQHRDPLRYLREAVEAVGFGLERAYRR